MEVVLTIIMASLAVLSFALNLWQWLVALKFPLHQRCPPLTQTPAVTFLKPLKGCDSETEACLKSWFLQRYPGKIQILFGVASIEDPVCPVVEKLFQEFPKVDARLLICRPDLGANAKVSSLVQLQVHAKHDCLVISDADVHVPPDLLNDLLSPLSDSSIGLVNCFYSQANPVNLAMRWEAIAVNADFWSQVLQAQSLKPIDFALGAVMATTRVHLERIGGFAALLDYLADDYQLGHKIAEQNSRIQICPIVVECRSHALTLTEVWKHQLRWARTIRICQPTAYFFSILSNATFWPLLLLLLRPTFFSTAVFETCLITRVFSALHNEARLNGHAIRWGSAWLIPIKDLLSLAIWAMSFIGNRIEWRGIRYRMLRGGRLQIIEQNRA